MKLPELKKHLKNKYTVRVIAGILTIVLVGGSAGAISARAKNNSTDETKETVEVTKESTEEEDDTADKIADELFGSISVEKKDVDKEENVYYMLDADGTINQTIVVDHLTNLNKEQVLNDVSDLQDITNVKGKETFTQNGNELTWQADGNDIYYQGTTAQKEAPVSQKVTYYLDGKEIDAKDLAGKSGKVTIRFDYENNETYETTINGKKQKVTVPFAAITAVMLNENFKNVEVTNARIEKNNDQSIILGYALPGLKESLQITDEDLDDKVNIPEYVEITADVENFELSTAMTFVVNASSYVSAGGISTDSLDDMIGDLTDATEQLQDGSAELADGADTLADGVGTLKDKFVEFQDGMQDLKKGLKDYTDGADTLADGTKTLDDGVSKLAGGSDTLKSGVTTLVASMQEIKNGIQTLNDTLKAGLSEEQKQQIRAQAVQAVKEAFKGEQESQVSQGIYAQLRYQLNDKNQVVGNGVLYTTLYNGTAAEQFQQNLDTAYAAVVNGVLSTATGQTGTSEELAAMVKASYAQGAAQYQASMKALAQVLSQAQVQSVEASEPVAMQQLQAQESVQTGEETSQPTETNTEVSQNTETTEAGSETVEAVTEESKEETAEAVTEEAVTEEVQAASVDGSVASEEVSVQSEEAPEESVSEETNGQTVEITEEAVAQVASAEEAATLEETVSDYAVQTVNEPQTQAIDPSVLAGLSEQNTQAFVVYNAIKNMTPDQLAEFLYAQNSNTTLLSVTTDKLNDTISQKSGQIQSGVEDALKTLAGSLTGACETVAAQVAEQAAVNGATGAMQTIYSSINAKQSNGYSLVSGVQALFSGMKELEGKVPELTSGIKTLKDGTAKLREGAATLVSNNKALLSGMDDLVDGGDQVADGVAQLKDGSDELASGAHELADGVVEFNEEGINKILDAYNGDFLPMIDRLQAVIDAGEAYQTYSPLAKDQTGSVKFIYKLSSIKAEEEQVEE